MRSSLLVGARRPTEVPEMTVKTVLMIAHDFPPIRTSGIYRPLKFAKYLSDFGWKPVIVSAQPFGLGSLDPSMLRELPENVEVVRTLRPSLLDWEARLYRAVLRRDPRDANDSVVPTGPIAPPSGETTASWRKAILRTVLSPMRAILQHALYFPDDANLWAWHAYRAAAHVIRRQRVDAIFSTSSPASAHLVGAALSKRFDLPLIADFRDPWTRNIPRQHDPKLRRVLERQLEITVLKRASGIVYISDRLADLARTAFPMISASKFHVIENGFDEGDFAQAPAYASSPNSRLELLNVGTIYGSSGFESILSAMEQLHAASTETAPSLRHIGPVSSGQRQRLSALSALGALELTGVIAHDLIAERMVAADVHILTVPDGAEDRPPNIPGKLYEQLRSGRPILFVGPESDTSKHILDSGAGWVFRADQRDAVIAKLTELAEAKRAGTLRSGAPAAGVVQFERRELTRQLAERLSAVASSEAS